MYAGLKSTPCCLCGRDDTHTRIAVPPRALRLMENGEPIAWRDVVGTVTLRFCADDWDLVSDLAIEMGTHPLSRCNAAHVSLDLREDHEALLSATKAETDQTELEARLSREAEATLDAVDDPYTEERDVVEAVVVLRALEELGVRERSGADAAGAAAAADDD
ncbi:hypothetical protein EXE48_07000 [Halorubrum sp. ASP1]|uniref:hypothetical protein n=1 Tax=unclassified Halorubrum TaxID=2642239 RepID=UPI000EF1F1D5|nr:MULTISPECIES: hypothetical protein [unclassified Halorubrum]RLM51516.1 hypothetical protein DVK06_03745 [Halorubrum sp. Atlit-28R]TKX61552.1 hypothetical protein EXE48_07000 [Halorubrum sp. ASP1]